MAKSAQKENGRKSFLSEYFKDDYKCKSIVDDMEKKIKSESPPKLVISVIGDSTEYTPNSWPTYRFKQALIHAVKTFGDSWILCERNTSMKKAGRVSMTVSEALKEYLQVPWQEMTEQPTANLYNIWKPETGDFPKEDEEIGKNILLTNTTPAHMISIVNKLSEQHVRAFYLETSYRMVLPVIIVVVEGDYETIKTVQNAVKNNIPVVLVKGSGMATDLIHYCLEQDKPIDKIPNLMQKIVHLFGEKTEAWSVKDRTGVLQNIVEKQNLLMSFDVYEDTPETFAEKAKQIILTSWALQRRVLTKIEPAEPPATSGSQNITENSKTETPAVVQDQNNKAGKNKVHPEQLATSVLQNSTENGMAAPPPAKYAPPRNTEENSLRTVDILVVEMMSLGSSLGPHKGAKDNYKAIKDTKSKKRATPSSPLAFYLFYQRLQAENASQGTGESIQENVITQVTRERNIKTKSLMMEALIAGEHKFVKVLMDCNTTKTEDINFKTLYDQAPDSLQMILKLDTNNGWNDERDKSAEKIIEGCPAAQRLKELLRNYNAYEIPSEEINYEITERLLLWAVQTNQIKMAEMLWKKTQYPILTALVASELLRKMSRKAWDNKEGTLSNDLMEHSNIFCQRAVDTAETFHKQHKNYAVPALEKQYYVWGVYASPIDFAMKYRQYTFVASEVTMSHFNSKWYRDSTYRTWRHLYLVFFQRNHCSCNNSSDRLRYLYCHPTCSRKKNRIYDICWATLTTFNVHYFFFILFLLCLSAFVLSNLKVVMPWNTRSVYEYMAYLWITGDFIEECKSAVIAIKDSQLRKKPYECFRAWIRGLYLHFDDFWNVLDFFGYVLMMTAVAFRFQEKEEFEDVTRQLFSFTMYVMYMRFLHVLLVSRSIGITIIMLKEALKELMRFVIIAAVFVISTGIFYHANLYPNHFDLFSSFGVRHWSIWRIVSLPFWAIFGEFSEELEGVGQEGCSNNETIYVNDVNVERCPRKDFLVAVVSGVYTMVASLLLVNLIIAMFTFRFQEIKNNSEKLWRFHRSKVINEFDDRSPSPFNFVWNFVFIAKWIFKRKDSKQKKTINDIKKIIKYRWEESDKRMCEELKKKGVGVCEKRKKKDVDGVSKEELKKRRKKAIKQIKDKMKETIEKTIEDQRKKFYEETIEDQWKKFYEEIEEQWKNCHEAIEKIKDIEEIKVSLEDDLQNIKKEVKKRWNKEEDMKNIQKTIAERWEQKGSPRDVQWTAL